MKTVVLLLLFSLSLYSVESNDKTLRQFIEAGLTFPEMNPVYKTENDSLVRMLRDAFKPDSNSQELREILFQELYNNSTAAYEDSYDIMRYKSRRATLFAAIALTADEDNYETFIDYAKYSLEENGEIKESLKTHYCTLLFLEIFIQQRNDPDSNDISFEEITTFLNMEKETVSDQFYEDAHRLIQRKKSN